MYILGKGYREMGVTLGRRQLLQRLRSVLARYENVIWLFRYADEAVLVSQSQAIIEFLPEKQVNIVVRLIEFNSSMQRVYKYSAARMTIEQLIEAMERQHMMYGHLCLSAVVKSASDAVFENLIEAIVSVECGCLQDIERERTISLPKIARGKYDPTLDPAQGKFSFME